MLIKHSIFQEISKITFKLIYYNRDKFKVSCHKQTTNALGKHYIRFRLNTTPGVIIFYS